MYNLSKIIEWAYLKKITLDNFDAKSDEGNHS